MPRRTVITWLVASPVPAPVAIEQLIQAYSTNRALYSISNDRFRPTADAQKNARIPEIGNYFV